MGSYGYHDPASARDKVPPGWHKNPPPGRVMTRYWTAFWTWYMTLNR